MDAIPGGAAYEELDELYDVWCAEVTEDVPFYLGLAGALAREHERDFLDIVELGGGSGRISLPLARAGHRVVALDASPAQLHRLEQRASAEATPGDVRAAAGDMRELADLVPAGSADLVVAPFRALLHVTADRDAVFEQVARCLRTGGAFAFDVFHPSAEQVAATHGRWLDRRSEPTKGGAWRFQERARYLPEAAREAGGLALEVDVRCRWKASRRANAQSLLDDPVRGAAERTALLQLQLVPAERWAASLERAGLELDGSYGWFDARPLGPEDDDSVWVARRS